jgi:hypothetical protein
MIYKVKPLKLFIFIVTALFSVVFFIFLIHIALSAEKDWTKWITFAFLAFLFIVTSIPFFLSLTYILEDWGKTVQFDEINHLLKISKKGNITTIKRDEIIAAYQVMYDQYSGSRVRFFWYKYAMIIKKERERVIITNLICEPEEVLSFFKIHYKTFFWNIPVISRSMGSEFLTTEEFNEEVAEFEENFRNYSKEQLQNVLRNPQTYTDYARKAASNLLDKKQGD